MIIVVRVHESFIRGRRIRRLGELLAPLIPDGCGLLDVGCGDGKLARTLLEKRPDLRIEGVDVLVREQTAVPVKAFNGTTLPYEESSFDGVMLIDVLHHTRDRDRLARGVEPLLGWGVGVPPEQVDRVHHRPAGDVAPNSSASSNGTSIRR